MNETSNEAKTTITYPEEFAKIRDAVFDEAAARLGYSRREMDDIADAMGIMDAMNEMTLVAVCRRAMGDGPLGRPTFKRWTYLVSDHVADLLAQREFEVGSVMNEQERNGEND